VESPGSGVVAEILVPAGETAEVGAVIARLQ
jgi:pyruvate/2-oxoglutarate dehydrogenase complex dihydrolipoamide acyltransferase (E2) component